MVGFAGPLDYNSEIENAVRTAVRDTLIVQNMDVARGNMGGVRMVTLDGTVFEASGAMVGGVSRTPSSHLGGGKALVYRLLKKRLLPLIQLSFYARPFNPQYRKIKNLNKKSELVSIL